MLAPCVSKWPTNSGKFLLSPSFIRVRTNPTEAFKNHRRLVATQMHGDQALVVSTDRIERTFQ